MVREIQSYVQTQFIIVISKTYITFFSLYAKLTSPLIGYTYILSVQMLPIMWYWSYHPTRVQENSFGNYYNCKLLDNK